MENPADPQISEVIRLGLKPPVPGLWLQHKPVGATSFELVKAMQGRVRAATGRDGKVCHGGVLDPFARGLVLVLVGPVTRVFDWLHDVPKTYVGEVAWGTETSSGDGGGEVLRAAGVEALSEAALTHALQQFIGWTQQVPPVMSNKRVDGERAWVRARRGEAVELEPVKVYLHSARWVRHELPVRSTLELVCRGGFYVRALVRDVARAAGSAAHLTQLERVSIGPYVDPGPDVERCVTGHALLPWLSSRALSDEERGQLRRGEPLERGLVRPSTWPLPLGFPFRTEVRAVHQERLVGLLADDGARLTPVVAIEK